PATVSTCSTPAASSASPSAPPTSVGCGRWPRAAARPGLPAMAELLLELLSEEIPARMQARAAEDLKRLVLEGLQSNGLSGTARAFATPRRLTLVVREVPTAQADQRAH